MTGNRKTDNATAVLKKKAAKRGIGSQKKEFWGSFSREGGYNGVRTGESLQKTSRASGSGGGRTRKKWAPYSGRRNRWGNTAGHRGCTFAHGGGVAPSFLEPGGGGVTEWGKELGETGFSGIGLLAGSVVDPLEKLFCHLLRPSSTFFVQNDICGAPNPYEAQFHGRVDWVLESRESGSFFQTQVDEGKARARKIWEEPGEKWADTVLGEHH